MKEAAQYQPKQHAASPCRHMPESRCSVNIITCAADPFKQCWDNILKGSAFMIIRQLKEKQFEHLHNALMMKAHAEPLEASYTVNMTINGAEYALKVQPERHNKMAVLQALRIFREEYGPNFELIEQPGVLSAFLEILIYQGGSQ